MEQENQTTQANKKHCPSPGQIYLHTSAGEISLDEILMMLQVVGPKPTRREMAPWQYYAPYNSYNKPRSAKNGVEQNPSSKNKTKEENREWANFCKELNRIIDSANKRQIKAYKEIKYSKNFSLAEKVALVNALKVVHEGNKVTKKNEVLPKNKNIENPPKVQIQPSDQANEHPDQVHEQISKNNNNEITPQSVVTVNDSNVNRQQNPQSQSEDQFPTPQRSTIRKKRNPNAEKTKQQTEQWQKKVEQMGKSIEEDIANMTPEKKQRLRITPEDEQRMREAAKKRLENRNKKSPGKKK